MNSKISRQLMKGSQDERDVVSLNIVSFTTFMVAVFTLCFFCNLIEIQRQFCYFVET